MKVPQDQRNTKMIEKSFLAYTHLVLSHMESWIKAGESVKFPCFQYRFLDMNGPIYYKPQLAVRYECSFLLWSHRNDIMKMEAAEQCAVDHWNANILRVPLDELEEERQACVEDDDLEPLTDTAAYEQSRITIFSHLIIAVRDLCNLYKTTPPTDEQILELYYRFRKMWAATHIHFEMIYPLLNFASNISQSVSVGTNIHLEPFSSEEKSTIWNDGSFLQMLSMPLPIEVFAGVKFKLTSSHREPKLSQSSSVMGIVLAGGYAHRLQMEIGHIVTALRLLKKGDVGISAIFVRGDVSSTEETPYSTKPIPDWAITQKEYRTRQVPFRPTSSLYVLEASDIPVLKDLLGLLHNLLDVNQYQRMYGDLTVAMRRFNLAYSRQMYEDQIIDLVISLESSLLAEDRKTTKKGKLSARGAVLLAKIKAPAETEVFLTKMYQARNDMVHGGKLLSEIEKEPIEFTRQCESMVRDILKEYLARLAIENYQSLKNVNNELDKYYSIRYIQNGERRERVIDYFL